MRPARFVAYAEEFSTWLAERQRPNLISGWVCTKACPRPRIDWADAVVEALRFGWIDHKSSALAGTRYGNGGHPDARAASPPASTLREETTPSYRTICITWVTSAKQQATNDKRMRQLIDDQAASRMIPASAMVRPRNGLRARRPLRERQRVTKTRINEFGQPIGHEATWASATVPTPHEFVGQHVRLEPLRKEHAAELFEAFGHTPEMWTYLPTEPPRTVTDMAAIIEIQLESPEGLPFLVRVDGHAVGTLAYLRIQPLIGSIEVGWVTFGPALQLTTAATEAQYLLMKHAFEDLGYRRYEWKCDSLNAPSRRAALRLGFIEEGTWRNALVYKGRNRDTTWFSITDAEWPQVRAGFEAWLAEGNFEDGQQRRSLAACRLNV